MKTILLAWRYICFHRLKTILLVACVSLTIALPIAIYLLLNQFNRQIVARADATPVVIGAKGSRLDLTLSSLYLQNKCSETIEYGEVAYVKKTKYAAVVPLHLGFTAQSHPIVGTSFDYFEHRDLEFADGNVFRRLGDCVIGWRVAQKQQLSVGDRIKSDRTSELDITSNPPLYMRVTGILERQRTSDDEAIFVDLKTTWILDGIGHGHEDIVGSQDKLKVLNSQKENEPTIASPAVTGELEVTDANLNSFHFHGDTKEFPITAIVAFPPDQKSRDLLMGRYVATRPTLQIVEPTTVVRDLMALVFRAKKFFDANSIIISLATFLMLVMVIMLSLKLREREMETMYKIGCSRLTIVKLQVAELAIIGLASSFVIIVLVGMIWMSAGTIVQSLLISN